MSFATIFVLRVYLSEVAAVAQVILHLRHARSHQFFGYRLFFLLSGDAWRAGCRAAGGAEELGVRAVKLCSKDW